VSPLDEGDSPFEHEAAYVSFADAESFGNGGDVEQVVRHTHL
jgi:hypothetical protein